MIETDFFHSVEHTNVPWQDYDLHVPVFYPDFRQMTATFLAPLDSVKALLPSQRLHPFRVLPGRAAVSITAYEYRESDLGPYNEVLIGFPVSLDTPLPLFTGSFRKPPLPIMIYVHTLPVTTEIARRVGADFAGYPKFVGEIDFDDEENWVTCTLALEGQIILSLKGKKLEGARVPRFRSSPLTCRDGYLLRSELVMSEREMGFSRHKENVELILGDHPIGEPLKQLGLGAASSYSYCHHAQGILTPVFESYKV